MSENFDAFAPDTIAPSAGDGIYFGELVLYRGFQGIWIKDSDTGKNKLWDFDPNDNEHKAAVASGKKPYIYYCIQAFPIGVSRDSFEENLINFSDEWQELCKSLAKVWGIDKVKSDAFSAKLREWNNQPLFAKWHNEIVEYKDKNGEDRKRYIKRVQELYPDLATAQAAHDAHRGINGVADEVPTGFEVQAMERGQALSFIETWCKGNLKDGKIDESELQAFIDSMPMLGDWETADPDIQKIVNSVGVPF